MSVRGILISGAAIVATVCVCVVGLAAYCMWGDRYEEVVAGEALGFRIDMDKSQTLAVIRRDFSSKGVHALGPGGWADGASALGHEIDLGREDDLKRMGERNTWEIRMDDSTFDVIRLDFQGNRLKRVGRARKRCEFP